MTEPSASGIVGQRVLSRSPGFEGRQGKVVGVAEEAAQMIGEPDMVARVLLDGHEEPTPLHVNWLEVTDTEPELVVESDGPLIDPPTLHRASKRSGMLQMGAEMGLEEDALIQFLSEAKFNDENGNPLPVHQQSLAIGIGIGLVAAQIRASAAAER